MLFKICLVVVAALCLSAGPAFAQQDVTPKKEQPRYQPIMPDSTSYVSDANYIAMLDQLLKNPKDFRYDLFRRHYITSKYYDPMAEDIKKRMFEYAYIIQTSDDAEQVMNARSSYNKIVRLNLGNSGVVALALSLSREDHNLGSSDFFETVRDGLFQDVLDSGDGVTLRRAYDVLTMEEETMLLSSLNVKVLKTLSAREGVWYYNMHDVEDLETGRMHTVFVNITIPMRYLKKQERQDGRALNLPR